MFSCEGSGYNRWVWGAATHESYQPVSLRANVSNVCIHQHEENGHMRFQKSPVSLSLLSSPKPTVLLLQWSLYSHRGGESPRPCSRQHKPDFLLQLRGAACLSQGISRPQTPTPTSPVQICTHILPSSRVQHPAHNTSLGASG